MLRILVISPWLPWPPYDGARIRILETLRALGRRHEVTLFAHVHSEAERSQAAALETLCESIRVALVSDRLDRRVARMAGALAAGKPLIHGLHFDRGLEREIAVATRQGHFDIVHIELSLIARYAAAVNRDKTKVVLSTHNIESQRFEREIRLSGWSPRRAALVIDKLLRPTWEQDALQMFDGAIAVSEADKAWLERHFDGRPVGLAPNGVDTGYFKRGAPYSTASNKLVFTGVMDYPPNVDAVAWFAREVFPAVRAQWPDMTLQIVGTRPTARVQALASQPGIEVTGEVEDVRPYVEQALAFIVPLRSGGGTRLKILQAMAMGCPVLSTRLGAEGLDVRSDTDILFAEDPAEFVAQLERLRASDESAGSIAEAARQLVLARYDWSACLAGVGELYRRVLGRAAL